MSGVEWTTRLPPWPSTMASDAVRIDERDADRRLSPAVRGARYDGDRDGQPDGGQDDDRDRGCETGDDAAHARGRRAHRWARAPPRRPALARSSCDLTIRRGVLARITSDAGRRPRPTQPRASIASASPSAIRTSSSSVTTNGGPSRSVSPSTPFALPVPGVEQQASLAGDPTTASTSFAARGYGSRVSRSWTSSTPTIRPRPRMSPTTGLASSRSWRRAVSRSPFVADASTSDSASRIRSTSRATVAADRLVRVGEAVDERPGARHRVVDLARRRHEPERPVTGGGALGRDQQVGLDAVVRQPEPGTGPPEAGHDLVGDEQGTVPAAHLGDRRPVAGRRLDGGQRRPDDRLGDERRHGPRIRPS